MAAFAIGYLMRKKHYKEIDRLEAKKITIMNRPVLDELARVKNLSMTGQTEKLFERWRREWDSIVTIHFPDVEELLFDAEDHTDKFLFHKSTQVRERINAKLDGIDGTIDNILNELNELVGSEEKNKQDIEDVILAYRDSKKRLLAHGHTYGEAANILEKQFDMLMDDFDTYENETAHGNYLQAREYVLAIQAKLQLLQFKLSSIPNLLSECQTQIPSLLHDLKSGYKEMVADGYPLEHLHFEREMNRFEQELQKYLLLIKNAELEDVESGLAEMQENIQDFYDVLEKEALAKQYIFSIKDRYDEDLAKSKSHLQQLNVETETVLLTYQLPDKEMETRSYLESVVTALNTKWSVIKGKLTEEKTAFSLLKEDIIEMEKSLETLNNKQTEYEQKLRALRKDELESRETVKHLQKKLQETTRTIERSNLPGLPKTYLLMVEQAKESIEDTKFKLEEKPLNMVSVKHYLDIAVVAVNRIENSSTEILECMQLAERMIQYGNRYRSQYPQLATELSEAEQKFRRYQYEEAMEQAATAIEKIEPGAFKKVQLHSEVISESKTS